MEPKNIIKFMLVSCAVVASFGATASKAGTGQIYDPGKVRQQESSLRALARSAGGTLSPIKLQIRQDIDTQNRDSPATAPEQKTSADSCTATATISVGGTGVTLSATAATCSQAIAMLEAGIKAYLNI